MREDSAIAIFWTLGMSIGIICSFLAPGFTPELSSYLFGNILTVTPSDLYLLGTLALIAIVVFTCFLRPLVSMAFDAEFARSQRLPVITVEYLMMDFIALTIVACLRMVGIVLVISLLSVPQMAAGLFARTYGVMAVLSVAFALLGSVGGLLLSYYYNVPSGATIVLLCIGIYFVAKAIKQLCSCLFTKSPA